jgi:hypothetical protein
MADEGASLPTDEPEKAFCGCGGHREACAVQAVKRKDGSEKPAIDETPGGSLRLLKGSVLVDEARSP